jgi:hypothetical protein
MFQFEQQEKAKFCQNLDKYTIETFQKIKQAYSEEALGHSAVFKWYKCFVQERNSLEDDEHTDRPRTVRTRLKIQPVAVLVHAKHSQMIGDVTTAFSGQLNTSFCVNYLPNICILYYDCIVMHDA